MFNYDVGIINYNSANALSACIQSLIEQPIQPQNIYVWDNNSEDNSIQIAQEKFPKVIFLTEEKNLGYGPSINRLRKKMTSDWMLFCNMDLEFDKHWSTQINEAIKTFPTYSSFASLIVEKNNPPTINAARILFHNDMSPYCPEDGEKLSDFQLKDQDVFGPYGAAIFISQKLFDTVGEFYEPFFLFYEETEYFIRANQNNFKTKLISNAKVWHHRSMATIRFSPMKIYYPERNRIISLRKNFGLAKALKSLIYSPKRYLNQKKKTDSLAIKDDVNSAKTPIIKVLFILFKAHLDGFTMRIQK